MPAAKTELTAKNNGYVSKDYMGSSNFAAFLNSPWTETEDLVWAYSNDAEGLPFFGTASTGQVVLTVPVVFKDGESVLSVKIGNKVVDVQDVKVGGAAVAPATPAPKGGQCFDKWSEDYTHIMAAVDILAQYKICTYTVIFTNEDGTKIFDTQTVEYNKNATAPTDLELPEGKCFDSWDGTYTNVKADLTVKVKTKACGNSSSSSSGNTSESSSSSSAGNGGNSSSSSSAGNGDSSSSSSANNGNSSSSNEGSSSSIANSSSSEYGSSSSSDIASSSSSRNDYSSSSINGKSSSSSSETIKSSSSSSVKSSSSKGSRSSSSNYIYEIAEPTAKQDGNALRMTLVDATTAGKFEKVDYHIQVVSETGVYLDTVVNGKSVENVKNGTWRLDPSPVGEYTVTFTLTDGVDSVSYDKKFVTEKEKTYIPRAWQTLSLYALCQNDGDDCVNQVEKLFARHRDGDNSVATTSVYWWDESNPVGDFWQYRKFSVKDKFDSTRGYWYGSVDNEPLVMNLQTPDTNDAIVWKLENKYSGWNLVANPYGWYVKLPKEKKLRFCQWNAESSDYEEPDVLGPYEAIWVHTEKSMTYSIPLKAAIVLEEEKKALSKSADSENWNLRVVLSDNNGKRDSWNELAAGKAASSLGEPPAGMGDRVNLSIVDGKKRLAKSVKQNADDLEWDLEVSATSTRDGHLNFEGLESVWAKGLRVYATVDNETVEVVKDSPVDVKLASKAKNVSVRVTKSAVAANVAKNLLKGLHVGQMSNVLNVGFDAASKLAGANVKVSVVGIDGRIVATDRAIAREGSNAISMKKPKQGVYFVKVKVGSLSAVTRVMVR